MCLIENTILLCTKCREIKPQLPARCMCHGISRVAAGTTSLNLSHCREIRPSFESGLSQYIPLETESTESLSPTYCGGKTPLEVLLENWLSFSVKDGESALNLRRYMVHGSLFTVLG